MAADIASQEGSGASSDATSPASKAPDLEQEGDQQEMPRLPPVQVCVRLRPLLGWECQEGHGSASMQLVTGRHGNVTLLPRTEVVEGRGESGAKVDSTAAVRNAVPRNFCFSAVFGPDNTQQAVWDEARLPELVDKVVEGFNATVLAYGQTGSGKTYTMEGFSYRGDGAAAIALKRPPRACTKETPPDQLGLVPRAVNSLFESIARHHQKAAAGGGDRPPVQDSYVVKVSFLQIYNERCFDLLNAVGVTSGGVGTFGSNAHEKKEEDGLRLRWDANRELFYVENLFEYECTAAEDAIQHYAAGVRNKQVASTAMNAASSRSHAVFYLTLTHRTTLGDSGDAKAPVREVMSSFVLVDLAGSERAAASSGAGIQNGTERFKEAVNINQSLFALRRVVTALCQRRDGEEFIGHVPYRDSKLTSLLQHTIGGNAFMLMFACLSPADRHYDENLSTLQYATQAACIKNEPVVNLDPKDKLIQKLKLQLAAAHQYILHNLGLDELPSELLNVTGIDASRRNLVQLGVQPERRHEPSLTLQQSYQQPEVPTLEDVHKSQSQPQTKHEHQQQQRQQQQQRHLAPVPYERQDSQHQLPNGQNRRVERKRSSSGVRLVLQKHKMVMPPKISVDDHRADGRALEPNGGASAKAFERTFERGSDEAMVESKPATPPRSKHRGGHVGSRGAEGASRGSSGGRGGRDGRGDGNLGARFEGGGSDIGARSLDAGRGEESSVQTPSARYCLWNDDGTLVADAMARSRTLAHEDSTRRCDVPHQRGTSRLPPIAPNSHGPRPAVALAQKVSVASPFAAYTQSQASFYGKSFKSHRKQHCRSSSALPVNRGSSTGCSGGRSASAGPSYPHGLGYVESGASEDGDLYAAARPDDFDAAVLREQNNRLEDELSSAQKRVQELETRLQTAALHARMAQAPDSDDEDDHARLLAVARKARAQHRRAPSSDEEETSSAGAVSARSDF